MWWYKAEADDKTDWSKSHHKNFYRGVNIILKIKYMDYPCSLSISLCSLSHKSLHKKLQCFNIHSCIVQTITMELCGSMMWVFPFCSCSWHPTIPLIFFMLSPFYQPSPVFLLFAPVISAAFYLPSTPSPTLSLPTTLSLLSPSLSLPIIPSPTLLTH